MPLNWALLQICFGLQTCKTKKDAIRLLLDAVELGKMMQMRSELRFLQSENIKWLIHEADIGTSHEDYRPTTRRIARLKKMLKEAEHK
jgi:hypothetical protein